MINAMISVAKKEIMDNIRSFWILIVAILFALLTVATSYFGSLNSQGWQDLGLTISIMMVVIQFIVPIIALMLGYAAIIGEIERGSMSALLSLPSTRLEVLLGKFLGLGSVLSFTLFVGFGIAGIVIGANVANVNYAEYLYFIGDTILVALVFLSIAIFFSTLFKKRSTAMGGAIFLWILFIWILPLVFVGIASATVGLSGILSGDIPGWYHVLGLFNPMQAYSDLVTFNVGPVATLQTQGGVAMTAYPSFFSVGFLVLVLVLWIVPFFILAFWRFSRADI